MYLLDANVFITAAKTYYPFDFAHGFWEFLMIKSIANEICVPQSVIKEISNGSSDDPLRQWVKENSESIKVVFADEQIQRRFGQIITDIESGAISKNFTPEGVANFASVADPWIIATASVYDMTIVTNETFAGENSAKIKIPNLCRHYDISCVTPFAMLRNLGINLCHQQTPLPK